MSNVTILRQYASKSPSALPNSVLFQSSDKFLTIFDAYPKSIFHFLVLPRIPAENKDDAGDAGGAQFTSSELRNLSSLLKTDQERSKRMIEDLRTEAQGIKQQIEDEMLDRYGFRWDVWIGFHAVPSMEHLHLHILSADLVSERMKNKKHYNSFHPSLGFFLHIKDVLEWFDSTPEYFKQVTELNAKQYEELLKEDLACFKCGSAQKTMPILKEHLQREWDKLADRVKRTATKRKVPDGAGDGKQGDKNDRTEEEIPTKKIKAVPESEGK